jgi:hypothetical protein
VTELSTSTDLGQTEARERCDRIKKMVALVVEDVIALYEGRGWLALGYQSWAELCRVEFDGVQLAPPQRREAVTVYREAGLSVRAIAAATGASVGTVHADLSGVQSRTPDVPDLFAGFLADRPTPTVHQEGVDLPTKKVLISGTDGKSYPRRGTAPATKAKKRPLSDDMREAMTDLEKLSRKFDRIRRDARYESFREHFRSSHAGRLHSITAELDVLLGELRGGGDV